MMKKLVYKYLTNTFTLTHLGLNKIDNLNDIWRGKAVSEDLMLIFGISKSEVKWLVKSWIRKQNKGFNFHDFWKVQPYKVRCIWTSEMLSDLHTFHHIDAEAELSRLLAEEIDSEIVKNLRKFYNNEEVSS